MKFGRVQTPPRPWLGMFTADSADDDVFVVGLAKDGPADRAGIEVADVVISVGGHMVESLADMWRKVWAQGNAGVEIPITLMRDGKQMEKRLLSADRNSFLKQASVPLTPSIGLVCSALERPIIGAHIGQAVGDNLLEHALVDVGEFVDIEA